MSTSGCDTHDKDLQEALETGRDREQWSPYRLETYTMFSENFSVFSVHNNI